MAKPKGNSAIPAAGSTTPSFELDGKNFEVVIPKMNIPVEDCGIMTAADVCASEKAQRHLVEIKSAAIREIAE